MQQLKLKKLINKILILGLTSLLFFLPTLNAFANSSYTEIIKVGYLPNSNLVEDIDSLNEKGYGYDILKKIEETSNLKFQFVEVDGDPMKAIETGLVDIAGLYFKTPEREEKFLYSEIPLGKSTVSLVTDDFDIFYDDPEALNGKTVTTFEEYIANSVLEEYCIENEISLNYIYGDIDDYTNISADLYLVDTEDFKFETPDYHSVLNVGTYNLYLISDFSSQDIMDDINEALLKVVADEGNFFLELEEKYFAQHIEMNHRGLTKEEAEILKERTLNIAYVSHYQPITFTNDNNQADGAMIDVINMLSETYDFEVEFHPYSIHDGQSVPDNIDIVATLYGGYDEYSANFDFTEAYFDLPMNCVVSPEILSISNSDFEIITNSPKIGVLEYLSLDFERFLTVFPNNEVILYNDMNELIDDYKDEKVDIAIFSQSASAQIEVILSDTTKTIIPIDLVIPMKFLVSKDISDEIVPIFNVMLDSIDSNVYDNILINNSNQIFQDVSFSQFFSMYMPYIAMLILVMIIIFILIYLNEQKKKKDIILNAYNKDSLTGLLSPVKFREVANDILKVAKPGEYELISFDIDLFKSINSYYSTDRGTQVLCAIGEALTEAYSGSSALLMRKASDQFVVLKERRDKRNIKEIYKTYIHPKIIDVIGEKFNLSLSFGIYVIDDLKLNITNIISFAETARLMGKSKHETSFIVFDDEMKKEYNDKVNITFRMEQALKDKEFYVTYQPKIDFETLNVSGAEALVRWKPRLGEPIYPDRFIPVFEKNGFVSSLDMFVLEEVCKFIVSNKNKLKLPILSVNISAVTILEDNVISRISNIISRYEVKPENIELEITESAIIGNETKFLIKIKQLKKMGFIVAIDDFGAGVSCLNRLSSIEADVLKLDKTFFDLKGHGTKNVVVVENVINMAKKLNMKTVAEGVETFGQALWLKDLNCDLAQGFYFEKPMSENKFKELLLKNKKYEIK